MLQIFSRIKKLISKVMSDSVTKKKDKIQSILNVFETGKPDGDYSNVTIFSDGPKGMRQITYGKSQTTEWGNLNKLIESYSNKNGKHSEFFKPYVSKIGKISLVNDKKLITELREAGSDPVMKEAQDDFFDEHYWKPAFEFFKDNGFTQPLSMLVIYDSFIHSGGILNFLRNRFPAKTPSKGGNEKEWIEQYLNVRHSWLANHYNQILRKTTYRTKNMIQAVVRNDWNLNSPFIANGVSVA
jgi:chitosanase